jgi:hypothetical protein
LVANLGVDTPLLPAERKLNGALREASGAPSQQGLRALLKTREEIAPMTTFLRYAYLSLVAYAALAIILLVAFAAHAEKLKPCAEKQ